MSRNRNMSNLMNALARYTNNNPYSVTHDIEVYFHGNVPRIFQMPTYNEYGIPSNVFEIFLARKKKFDRLENGIKWLLFIGGYCFIAHLCIKCQTPDVNLLYLLLGCSLPYVLSAAFINELFSTVFYCFLKRFEDNTELHRKYKKYLDAVKAYEYWQTVNTLDYWMNLNGHQFEEAVAAIFRRKGYSAKISKQGGDGGIDIVLRKESECIAVQCKAHKTPVGPSVVRDLYGTMKHFGYTQGMLVSRSGFTGGTIEFSFGKNIQLISLNQLMTMVCETEPTHAEVTTKHEIKHEYKINKRLKQHLKEEQEEQCLGKNKEKKNPSTMAFGAEPAQTKAITENEIRKTTEIKADDTHSVPVSEKKKRTEIKHEYEGENGNILLPKQLKKDLISVISRYQDWIKKLEDPQSRLVGHMIYTFKDYFWTITIPLFEKLLINEKSCYKYKNFSYVDMRCYSTIYGNLHSVLYDFYSTLSHADYSKKAFFTEEEHILKKELYDAILYLNMCITARRCIIAIILGHIKVGKKCDENDYNRWISKVAEADRDFRNKFEQKNIGIALQDEIDYYKELGKRIVN